MPVSATPGSATTVPGTIEELGGRSVHRVRHSGAGPAVLLLGGCGVPYYLWDDVVDLLPDLQVERMDRPGLVGTPWPGVLPRLESEVDTLADLIGRTGGPAIVVAHSMAGPHAEALARRHPEHVAGLVLADSSVEWDPSAPRAGTAWLTAAKAVRSAMAAPPLRRIGSLADRVMVAAQSRRRRVWDRVPPVEQVIYRSRETLAHVIAEQAAYAQQLCDLAELRRSADFPPVPVVVLTAAGDGGKQWVADQARLAELLQGRQVVVEDSRHLIMLDRPDLVAEAVRSVRSTVAGPA